MNNTYKNNQSVSYVIGVILMIAIVVSLAAVISLMFSQTVNPDEDVLPMVGITVNTDSQDEHKAMIFIETVVLYEDKWEKVEYVLVDLDEAKQLEEGNEIIITSPSDDEYITAGQQITINENGGSGYLKEGNEYRFSINEKIDSKLMGTIRWTQ